MVLVFFLLAACSSNSALDKSALIEDPRILTVRGTTASTNEYILQIEDLLDIKFFFNSELNEEKIPIRPDGRISLQLIGEVMAAGRTPAELSTALRKLYERELRKPEVAVIVRSVAQHRVYVDGEVEKPNEIELRGSLTVLQAIARAGGLKESGKLEDVLIIRRGSEQHPIVFRVNLQGVLEGAGDTDQDISLSPYDIVYVPRSTIGDVNRFVHLYIRKNIPFGFGLFWNPFM